MPEEWNNLWAILAPSITFSFKIIFRMLLMKKCLEFDGGEKTWISINYRRQMVQNRQMRLVSPSMYELRKALQSRLHHYIRRFHLESLSMEFVLSRLIDFPARREIDWENCIHLVSLTLQRVFHWIAAFVAVTPIYLFSRLDPFPIH